MFTVRVQGVRDLLTFCLKLVLFCGMRKSFNNFLVSRQIRCISLRSLTLRQQAFILKFTHWCSYSRFMQGGKQNHRRYPRSNAKCCISTISLTAGKKLTPNYALGQRRCASLTQPDRSKVNSMFPLRFQPTVEIKKPGSPEAWGGISPSLAAFISRPEIPLLKGGTKKARLLHPNVSTNSIYWTSASKRLPPKAAPLIQSAFISVPANIFLRCQYFFIPSSFCLFFAQSPFLSALRIRFYT